MRREWKLLTDHFQTPEELAAHYGPGGPVAVVNDFLELVMVQRNLAAAWRLLEQELRSSLARAWVWANRETLLPSPALAHRDRAYIAERLTEGDTDYALWPTFAEIQLGEFHEIWSAYHHGKWGAGSRPRPVSPGYELVVVMETGGEPMIITEPTPVLAITFLMHAVERQWYIAAFGQEQRSFEWPE